jgi:hypothetical protein
VRFLPSFSSSPIPPFPSILPPSHLPTDSHPLSHIVGVTAIGYVRLSRARRSQLFLRSALQPRADEELTHSWRAGPVQPPTRDQVKEVREEDANEKEAEKEDGEGMSKKDGTQI